MRGSSCDKNNFRQIGSSRERFSKIFGSFACNCKQRPLRRLAWLALGLKNRSDVKNDLAMLRLFFLRSNLELAFKSKQRFKFGPKQEIIISFKFCRRLESLIYSSFILAHLLCLRHYRSMFKYEAEF